MKNIIGLILASLISTSAFADLNSEELEAKLAEQDYTVVLNQDITVSLQDKANHPYWFENAQVVEERTLLAGTKMKIATMGCVGGGGAVELFFSLVDNIIPTFYCSAGFEIEEGLFFNIHDSFAREEVSYFFEEHIKSIIEPLN